MRRGTIQIAVRSTSEFNCRSFDYAIGGKHLQKAPRSGQTLKAHSVNTRGSRPGRKFDEMGKFAKHQPSQEPPSVLVYHNPTQLNQKATKRHGT